MQEGGILLVLCLSGVPGGEKMGGARGTGMQRYSLFMWIATALWLIAAIAAVVDGDTLNAVAGSASSGPEP